LTDVSVVIAAWNAERYLAEALASVDAQTSPPLEVIVVDDGSTDATASIADDHGAIVLRFEHRGIGPSRNAGLAASHGDVIAFLDADDLWLPTKLERQVACLATDPDLGAVSCMVDEFLDRSADASTSVRQPNLGVTAAISSGATVRRAVVDQIGPFDEDTTVADWVDWWARLRRLGVREHTVPEVLVRRRIHDQNNSARRHDGGEQFLAVARQQLRARRQGS
jgi:glycosyltransferase involved in cell wall biosynthesis